MRWTRHLDWMCYMPLVGVTLVYSYYPLAYFFGTYEGPLYHTDPKCLGALLFYYYWITRLLAIYLFYLIIPYLIIFVVLVISKKVTINHVLQFLLLGLTISAVLLIRWVDPCDYLSWYVD